MAHASAKAAVAAASTPSTAGRPATPLPTAPQVLARASLTGKVKLPTGLVKAAGGLISDNGGGILSNNGASILSNNGASLISDNGGGILSNNGGSYHLLAATDQVPVAKANVYLLDASGHLLKGADGAVLVATSTDDGSFAFTGQLPGGNLLAAVDLGKAGIALANVVQGSDGALTLDLVSSLTARYIMDRYVSPQSDHQATLNRLTPDADATTRTKMATSLAASAVAVPDLGAASVEGAVDALRKQDTGLDAQWEVVRKLLVAAGQLNLGDGQVATTVSLDTPRIAQTKAGVLYVADSVHGRVYRMVGDRLVAVAGNGVASTGQVVTSNPQALPTSPVDALTWPLGYVRDLRVDANDQLVIIAGETETAWRLGADGRIVPCFTSLFGAADTPMDFALRGDGGAIALFYAAPADQLDDPDFNGPYPFTLATFDAAGTRHDVASWQDPHRYTSLGLSADGAAHAWLVEGAYGDDWRMAIDPATGQRGTPEHFDSYNFDADLDGTVYMNLYEVDATDFTITALAPGGQPQQVAHQTQAEVPEVFLTYRTMPDGTLYASSASSVYRIANGRCTLVAGLQAFGGTHTGSTQTQGLNSPGAAVVLPDGTMYVSDLVVYRFSPTKTVDKLAFADGSYAERLALSPDGRVVVSTRYQNDALFEVPSTGTGSPKQIYPRTDRDPDYFRFLPLANGELYLTGTEGKAGVLRKLSADGTIAKIASLPDANGELAAGPNGSTYLVSVKGIWRLGASGFEKLGDFSNCPAQPFEDMNDMYLYPAVDAKGRVYVVNNREDPGTGRVLRWDPTTNATRIIAGDGSSLLVGKTVDDSLADQIEGICLSAAGDLYIPDAENHQVKHLTAAQLDP